MSSQTLTYRFLLVDDSRAIQSIIRRAIESCGYESIEVRIAGDGDVAMEMLNNYKPDLIITDWHMPNMSGLEFCQQVRQVHGDEMLIGFVTTESSQEKIIQAHQSGASFVIIKPFSDADLSATVLKLLPKEVEDQPIITAEKCTSILNQYFSKKPFALTPCTPVTLPELTDNNLIGLYGPYGKAHPVVAIAIMDMNTVAILWGAAENQDAQAIKALIASNAFNDAHTAKANEVMKEMSRIVKFPENADEIGLSRSNVLSRTFPKLASVLASNSGRADFKLTIPNVGEGIISFILV